jgi:beta-fructofuranosidase
MLRLPDHWVWDSWTAIDGADYHLFFLRASRALLDPTRRHLRAGIGHAVSTDLRNWTLLPDALVHTDAPGWDSQAVWTGSVIKGPDGTWYMFYSGVAAERGISIQRIGLALSTDLVVWHRYRPEPLLQADPRWYECIDGRPGASVAWRDPFVFADPDGDGWHMIITARARSGPVGYAAVIGHARSADLVHWDVQPPLTAPAGFYEQEVAQVQWLDGAPVLLFSCMPDMVAPEHRSPEFAATWTVVGERLADGWDATKAVPFAHPSLYTARLLTDVDGSLCLLGFRNFDDQGRFIGEILDPVPVRWTGERLVGLDDII